MEERGRYRQPGQLIVECGICWTWDDPTAMPMHEALIPRGHVVGRKGRDRDVAFHPCNSVIRHDHCPEVRIGWDRTDPMNPKPIMHKFVHESGTGGDLAFRRAAAHLVFWEGYDEVEEYLIAAYNLYPTFAGNALDRFRGLNLRAWIEGTRDEP